MKDRGNERIEFLPTDETIRNVLIDLSSSGAAMNCPTEKKKDSRVLLKVKDYQIEGTVIYCQAREKEYRMGVHFINVPAEVQKSLKLLVEEFSRGVPIQFDILDQDEKKKV